MAVQRIERGDLWRSKARYLQLRLRDRFRVAVDKHRRLRPAIFDDVYFSSTVQRLLQRLRDFRRDSLPSSSTFYRKRVSKEFSTEEESMILKMVQAVAVPVLGNMCHVFMRGLNHVQVYGLETLHDALLHRPRDKPLVTVSNHVASVDDPFVIASLLPPSVLLDAQNLRWTLCATDRCFKNPVTSAFFKGVKVLPVARGDGIYQKGMDMAISKLNQGGWVHIFPEGSRSRDGGKTLGSPKRGVGRLVLDADNIPMVIPFVHTGMQDVMPIGANIPRIGKMVVVLVGEPIQFDDLFDMEGSEHISRGKLYDAVASRIGQRLHELKLQVDKLALEQPVVSFEHVEQKSGQAMRILQQVDWEMFGFESTRLSEELSVRVQKNQVPPEPNLDGIREQQRPDERFHLSYNSSFLSRMQGYVDPSEFMGFAARGLFAHRRESKRSEKSRGLGPLVAWKQFLQANLLGNWNTI